VNTGHEEIWNESYISLPWSGHDEDDDWLQHAHFSGVLTVRLSPGPQALGACCPFRSWLPLGPLGPLWVLSFCRGGSCPLLPLPLPLWVGLGLFGSQVGGGIICPSLDVLECSTEHRERSESTTTYTHIEIDIFQMGPYEPAWPCSWGAAASIPPPLGSLVAANVSAPFFA
jgi:hypothetical protein